MADNETLEAFRIALLRQAHSDFIDWAWHKDEIMAEYHDFCLAWSNDHAEDDKPTEFVDWVTEHYWGELE
jgi:hypothetical protein